MISIESSLLHSAPVKINDLGLDKSFDENDLTSISLHADSGEGKVSRTFLLLVAFKCSYKNSQSISINMSIPYPLVPKHRRPKNTKNEKGKMTANVLNLERVKIRKGKGGKSFQKV